MTFQIKTTGGTAQFFRVTPRVVAVDSSVATRFDYQFAYHVDNILTSLPANVLGSKTAIDPGEGQINSLYNRWMNAAEILRFTPLDAAGAGYGNGAGATNNLEFNITIHYLDWEV